jgi:hypothetical protein
MSSRVVLAVMSLLAILSLSPKSHADGTVALRRVNGVSPYSPGSCETPTNPQEPGYESEAVFAVSPQGLVAAWAQDGAPGLGMVTAHSDDDGISWMQSVPPAYAGCGTSGALRVANPQMVVDGAGTIFLSSVGGPPDPRGRVVVTASHDGGVTWPETTSLGLPGVNDWPTMSASPIDPHAAAIVWKSDAPDLTWFARTTDDGATWSVPIPIRVTPPGGFVENGIATLPDGTLLDVFIDYPVGLGTGLAPDVANHGKVIGSLHSTDSGATWSETTIATLSDDGTLGSPVVGRDGAAYVQITDGASTDKILRSIDGVHWTDFATAPAAGNLAIARDGTLGLLFYDHRNDVRSDQELTTDVWLSYSRDDGQTWSDAHLAGPFDLNKVTNSFIRLWDLHAVGNGFGATFPLGAPFALDGSTDVFYAQVSWPQTQASVAPVPPTKGHQHGR